LQIISDMESMVKGALEDFRQHWADDPEFQWPKQLVFYRNGVSDSEIEKVRQTEETRMQRIIVNVT